LWAGQAVDLIRERRAELMQPRIGELHLGLHARRANDPKIGRATGETVEQRCLAHPRLAAEDQHPAVPSSHARE
jgi:hypothetical protein